MKTLSTLKHTTSWQSSRQEMFAPVYSLAINGTNDRIKDPGNR